MFRTLCFLILILCPIITISQDLKFELLTKWESSTPEFPIDFGNRENGVKLFNIGDFDQDGINDVGLRTSKSIIIWDKHFGGSGRDYTVSIQETSDGGYILGGSSESNDGDISDSENTNWSYWVVKLDVNGIIIWDKTFGGSEYDILSSVKQTSDGGYIVSGGSDSNDGDVSDGNNGSRDYWILKLDPSGNKVWDKTFGGAMSDTQNDSPSLLQQTLDGGYIIAGHTESSDGDISDGNNGSRDYWILKLDPFGNKVWDKTLGGTGSDSPSSIQQTSDGGYIIAGYSNSNDGDISDGNNGGSDYWILKLDGSGNKVWDKTYGGSKNDASASIQKTSDGGYVIAGYTYSNDEDISDGNNGGSDYWILKLDSFGDKVWDKTLGGTGNDSPSSIQQTSDGGYIVLGDTDFDDNDAYYGHKDCWIVKLDSLGNEIWNETFSGPSSDQANSIIQTSGGDFIFTGYTGGSHIMDGLVVKLEGKKTPNDSLYVLTINSDGSVKNRYPIVPEVSGFNYSGQRKYGYGGFGSGLVNMGDMDGNGTNDFIVSSPHEKLNDSTDGAFFVLFMHSDGSIKDFHVVGKSEISNRNNVDFFAYSMVAMGDLDNDGINEIAVNTSELFSNNILPDTSESGGVYVLFFNPDGSLKKWSLNTLLSFRERDPLDVSSNTGIYAIENTGDLDSNGVDDLLIDHFEKGISILYLDSMGKTIDLKQISKENSTIKTSGNYIGKTLNSIIDIDNDGNNEIISQFSTSSFDTVPLFTTGIIYFNDSFSISNFQLINPDEIDGVDLDISRNESFGNRSIYLGDVNGDGYPEIGILDMHKNNSSGNHGVFYIVSVKPGDCVETECVWPGDANNDGVANSKDVLNIGRGFNIIKNANKRILPVSTWIAQNANEWGELVNDVDMKFADCDGNGIINSDDISPIKLNYNLAHKKRSAIEFDENGPLLRIVPAEKNVSPSGVAQFDIFLGEQIKNAENIFGLNMMLRPTSNLLYDDSIYIDYSDSWIGNVDSNAINFEHQLIDEINFAIARTDYKNTTNYGKIATINIPLNNNEIDKFTLDVTELNIESYEGDIVLVNEIITDSISVVDSTEINSHISYISAIKSYPNPTSGRLFFNLKEEIKNISIYSAVGYLVKNESVNAKSFNIDLSNLKDGIYFISLQGIDSSYQSKITLKK